MRCGASSRLARISNDKRRCGKLNPSEPPSRLRLDRFREADLSGPISTTVFRRVVSYSVGMNSDLASGRSNIQALVAMWKDEEKRLRLILEDPQTSSSIERQVTAKLASVLAQLKDRANYEAALQQAG